MYLVDTSVWTDHLRGGDYQLMELLQANKVLACGHLKQGQKILALLERLGQCRSITNDEARYFLEENQLMGRGIGFIDIHLLGDTALQMNAQLWTRDKRLRLAAEALNLAAPFN